jgi:hypothetical protein
MHKSLSLITTFVVAAAGALAGCGGSSRLPDGGGSSGLSDGVAVQIGSRTISKAAIEHWLPIETYITGHDIPKEPPPKGLIPDPPNYTACIGYERHLAEATRRAKLTVAQLKSQCQRHWEYFRTRTINNLILNDWLLGETTERNIMVSDREARAAMARNVHHLFKTSADFHQYLNSTRQTEADELERTKTGLIASRFFTNVILRKGGAAAYAAFLQKWVAKTDCAPDYVISDCKQYKGPLPPLRVQG